MSEFQFQRGNKWGLLVFLQRRALVSPMVNFYLILKTKDGILAWQVQVNCTQKRHSVQSNSSLDLFSIFSKLIISSSPPSKRETGRASKSSWVNYSLFLFLLYYFVVFFCSQSCLPCLAISRLAPPKKGGSEEEGRRKISKISSNGWNKLPSICDAVAFLS